MQRTFAGAGLDPWLGFPSPKAKSELEASFDEIDLLGRTIYAAFLFSSRASAAKNVRPSRLARLVFGDADVAAVRRGDVRRRGPLVV